MTAARTTRPATRQFVVILDTDSATFSGLAPCCSVHAMCERQDAPRVAFVSYHAAFDPTNGAARSMRDILHLLAQMGCATASLTGPRVDSRRDRGRDLVLRTIGQEGGGLTDFAPSLFATTDRGTPSLFYLPSAANTPEPTAEHGAEFTRIATRFLQAFQADVVLTYGGGGVGRALIEAAKGAGCAVGFVICNFNYSKRDLFTHTDGILVPAKFVANAYARALNIECRALPSPLDWERAIAPERAPRFLTYVAPTEDKGMPLAARILEDLAVRRPDIPLLVVEGRGSLAELARRIRPEARSRIQTSRTVADPRAFLATTRVLLVPSYVEAAGRLAQEALVNEIPVIASDRGGLPETLEGAGTVLPVPQADEPIASWTNAIERLWDEPDHFAAETTRAAAAKHRFSPDVLAPKYLRYVDYLMWSAPPRPSSRATRVPMPALDAARAATNALPRPRRPVPALSCRALSDQFVVD